MRGGQSTKRKSLATHGATGIGRAGVRKPDIVLIDACMGMEGGTPPLPWTEPVTQPLSPFPPTAAPKAIVEPTVTAPNRLVKPLQLHCELRSPPSGPPPNHSSKRRQACSPACSPMPCARSVQPLKTVPRRVKNISRQMSRGLECPWHGLPI